MRFASANKALTFSLVFIIIGEIDVSLNGAFLISGHKKISYLSKYAERKGYNGGMRYWPIQCLQKILDYVPVDIKNRAN